MRLSDTKVNQFIVKSIQLRVKPQETHELQFLVYLKPEVKTLISRNFCEREFPHFASNFSVKFVKLKNFATSTLH